MSDRFRQLFRFPRRRGAQVRRVSRREREEAQRRILIISVAAIALVLVLILAGGAFYQYYYLPRQTLASVNGAEIRRGDYWKVRKLALLNQIAQYSQFAQFSQGEQATQYRQLAEQASQQLNTVESDEVDSETLDQMVGDEVVLQGAAGMGLGTTADDIDQFIQSQFGGPAAASPTPTLPIDPTAEVWATATAEARAQASATSSPDGTPGANGTPSASPSSSDTATPDASAATPGTPSASPATDASPTSAPSPTATLDAASAQATATASFNNYRNDVLSRADMDANDFRRLVVAPTVARTKVANELGEEILPRQEQVHAEHILVATKEAADVIANESLKTADFEQVAKDRSADESTAGNGGDLGWFPRGIMVAEFEDVAFNLQPGEVSQPVQTRFGWHIIKVLEREEDRPVAIETLQQLRGKAVDDWTQEQRAAANIDWNVGRPPATPTPTSDFAPPPGAPIPPAPTPAPTTEPPATDEPGQATPAP